MTNLMGYGKYSSKDFKKQGEKMVKKPKTLTIQNWVVFDPDGPA